MHYHLLHSKVCPPALPIPSAQMARNYAMLFPEQWTRKATIAFEDIRNFRAKATLLVYSSHNVSTHLTINTSDSGSTLNQASGFPLFSSPRA